MLVVMARNMVPGNTSDMLSHGGGVGIFWGRLVEIMRQQRLLAAPFVNRQTNASDQCRGKYEIDYCHALNLGPHSEIYKSGANPC